MKNTNFRLNYPDQGQPVVVLNGIFNTAEAAPQQEETKAQQNNTPAAPETPESKAEPAHKKEKSKETAVTPAPVEEAAVEPDAPVTDPVAAEPEQTEETPEETSQTDVQEPVTEKAAQEEQEPAPVWAPQYGLNHIPESILLKAQNIVDQGGIGDISFATNNKGENLVSFEVWFDACSGNQIDYDNLVLLEKANVFKRMLDTPLRTCGIADCGEVRCIPTIAAYIKYAKKQHVYDQLLKERDAYRNENGNKDQALLFAWEPNNAEAFAEAPAYVFDIAEKLLQYKLVSLKPYSLPNGRIQVDYRLLPACADTVNSNAIEKLYEDAMQYENEKSITRVAHLAYDTNTSVNNIEREGCSKCQVKYCPYKMAAYMQYLQLTEQQEVIDKAKADSISTEHKYDAKTFAIDKIAAYISGRLLMQKLLFPEQTVSPVVLYPNTTITAEPAYRSETLGIVLRNEILNNICVNMSGLAAETILLGDYSNQGIFDINEAVDMATDMIKEYGMSEHGFASFGTLTDAHKEEINKLLTAQFTRAQKELSAHKPDLEQIYQYLLQHESITDSVIAGYITEKPAGAKRGRKPKNAETTPAETVAAKTVAAETPAEETETDNNPDEA